MSAIDIVFGAIEQMPDRQYIEQRINAMFYGAELRSGHRGRTVLAAGQLQTYADGIVRSRRGGRLPDIPLARRYDLQRLSVGERKAVKRYMRCLIATVNRQFPLLDGEHLETDFPTYLRADWEHYPRYTVVLRRITNLGTSYYLLPDTQVDLRQRRVIISPAAPTGSAPDLPLAAIPDFSGLARDIAKALAGKAPPPLNIIGVFLINEFWSSGDKASADWDKVYEALQSIIKNGLAKAEVDRAATKIKGFVSFLSNEYIELKKSPRRRPDDLLRALQPYDTAFFMDIVNVFMFAEKPTADIAAASLASFLLGANLHIALNQERALVDPNYVDDPARSPYARTAANLAKTYGDYATAALQGVIDARLKQVTGVKEDHKTHCTGGSAARCTTFWYYWFEDNNPKPRYKSKVYSYNDQEKHPPAARKQAKEARAAYVKTLNAELKKQVPEVVKFWKMISDNPIAMSYSAPTTAPVLNPEGWSDTTPVKRSRKWREGYKVRYAVSYYHNRRETEKGPWWSPEGADKEGYLDGTPNALPTLTDLPVDPFYHAEGRRLYRQFSGFREELIATIKDNGTLDYHDTKK